jgi:hypothetical protein
LASWALFETPPRFSSAPIAVSIAEFGHYSHRTGKIESALLLVRTQAADTLKFAKEQRLVPRQLVMIDLQHIHAAK